MRLQRKLPEIEAAGGALVAISVEEPSELQALYDSRQDSKTPITFPLLGDPSRETIKRFGVYDADSDIALPTILVLDRSWKVRWKYASEAINDRPPEDDVIAALREIRG